jgi:glycosyltransferase involved in cell wall biosynthesis
LKSLCFIVESGTDVRLVEGLAQRFDLSIVARRIEGGVEISQTPQTAIPILIGPPSRFAFARFVWRHLRKHRNELNLVLVQGYGLAALVANLAGRLNRIPTAMIVCSPVEAYYRCRRENPVGGKNFRRRELFMLTALARVNAIVGRQYVVLSHFLATVVKQHGGRAPVSVIPVYGVDSSLFTPPVESKMSLRERLGLPTAGSLIFFSSRVAPEKDCETLLAAFRSLLDEGRDLWLLHRSGGYQTFIAEAEKFGVRERVIATDAVHPHRQLPLDYQASDLCIQASREEGLGFSPLEALACEVPVVATAVGGLQETIVDGETGWSCPVGDSQAMARCIAQVLDDRDEADRRAAAGREMVCARYERDVVFEQLERMTWIGAKSEIENQRSEVTGRQGRGRIAK